tara:strand:+ start:85 stop:513 length:429 start_codon:yes stop_codon:yes gene_type:complete
MANVNISFNGKEFLLSCEDGQEEHLEELTNKLNNKFNGLKNSLGNIGENKLLLITSITIMDEYYETKKNIENKKKEISELIEKFKELKSLVYNYKKEKELNISELNKSLNTLNNQIEENMNNYNIVLDNTTSQIENFIKKST